MDIHSEADDLLAELGFGEEDEEQERPTIEDVDYAEIGDPREKW